MEKAAFIHWQCFWFSRAQSWFPEAAETNHPRPAALKQRKRIILLFWRSEAWRGPPQAKLTVWAGPCSFWSLPGRRQVLPQH